jgi:hypothetical protein
MPAVCEPSVHAAAGNREESAGSERRDSERFRCNWYPTVSFLARSGSLVANRGVIHDVSRRGMGLISEQSYEPGTILAIQLRSAEAGFSGVLSARVVHVAQMSTGHWLLGCSLSRNLTDAEITALL